MQTIKHLSFESRKKGSGINLNVARSDAAFFSALNIFRTRIKIISVLSKNLAQIMTMALSSSQWGELGV